MPLRPVLALSVLVAALAARAGPRFVDPAAAAGGDGSSERPYRALEDALRPGADVRLRSGEYVGTWTVPAGVRLRGEPGVVLRQPEGGAARPTLDLTGDAVLMTLELRGGATALRTRAKVRLEDVVVAAAGPVPVDVDGGRLEAIRLHLIAGPEGGLGMRIRSRADVTLRSVSWRGRFTRGLDAKDATVALDDCQFLATQGGVHAEDARVRGTRLTILGAPVDEAQRPSLEERPGIFLSGSTAELSDVLVVGHEYGVLVRHTSLTLARVSSWRAQRAAIASVGGILNASDVFVASPGAFGALQLSGGRSRFDRLIVTGWREQAIALRTGALHVTDAAILEPARRDDGEANAVAARLGTMTLERVRIQGAGGACVLASSDADVRVRASTLEGCTWALVSETHASLRAGDVRLGATEAAIVAVERGRTIVYSATLAPRASAAVETDCTLPLQLLATGLRTNGSTRFEADGGDERPQRMESPLEPACVVR